MELYSMVINRQAILTVPGQPYTLVDGPVPAVGPKEALVNLTHSGCCYTDTHARFAPCSCFGGGHIRLPGVDQLVGGHEGIGIITEIGAEAGYTGLSVGDRVGMGFLSKTCKSCEMCTTGDEAYCPRQIPTGFKCDGTFQQYAVFDAEYLIPIPKELDSAASAPLLCAGATVYSGLKAANIKAGQWVVVPGSGGGLGHIAVQYAKAMGARVIGIDAGDKQEVSMSCGTEHFLDFQTDKDIAGKIIQLTDGGAHVVLVTSVPAYTLAWQYARLRSVIVCIAMGPTDFDASLAVVKGIRVIGSSTSSRAELKEALDLAVKGNIKSNVDLRTMDDIERTMSELKRGAIKGRVVIDLSK